MFLERLERNEKIDRMEPPDNPVIRSKKTGHYKKIRRASVLAIQKK
jgi:hypothetical protein